MEPKKVDRDYLVGEPCVVGWEIAEHGRIKVESRNPGVIKDK